MCSSFIFSMTPDIIFCLLLFCAKSLGLNIIDGSIHSCSYEFQTEEYLRFMNKAWHVTDMKENVEALFNPCDVLSDKVCGSENTMACIKNKTGDWVRFQGNKFHTDEIGNLAVYSNKRNCSLRIVLKCSQNMQIAPQLTVIGECEYEVIMMDLNCTPKCTTRYNNQLIDLRPLHTKQIVLSENYKFSIVVCGTNPDCGMPGVASCDITDNNTKIPLALDQDDIRFNGDNMEIEWHGKFKGKVKGMAKKVERHFELLIKCDWSANSSEIHYKKLPIQGKNYKFEMKSPHGCFGVSQQCELFDKYYKYNLTSLHNGSNWEVHNVPSGRKILLNICGSLHSLPSDNNCARPFSQVCEISDGKYRNMGSMQTKFAISNEIISTSFINGETCQNNNTQQYTTYIEFKCSAKEEYPIFVRNETCGLVLSWSTPAACPIINRESCSDIHSTITDTVNKTLENNSNLKNLSKKHVKDNIDPNIEYMLNIGGLVMDEEAPCMKNAMVAFKNLTEYDLRHKVKSLGQIKTPFENDKGQLVIETHGGSFCPKQQSDYNSTIFLECFDKEDEIKIINKTDCSVDFLWRTKTVCPKTKTSSSSCLFENPIGFPQLLNFTAMKQTHLKMTISQSTYLFDLCGENESKCSKDTCIYVPVNKSLVTHSNSIHLEFTLNRTCTGANQFNKTLFQLVCDKITNNDHFEFKALSDCTMIFQLKTHQVCSEKDLVIAPATDKVTDKFTTAQPRYSVAEQNDESVLSKNIDKNCSVLNHYTGYKFNISHLNLNISSQRCPEIAFSETEKSVTLLYTSNKNNCGNLNTLTYKVILKCSSQENPKNSTENGECMKKFIRYVPEACKLLEKNIINNSHNYGTMAGIIVGSVAAVLLLIGLSILGFLKCKSLRGNVSYDSIIYEKDGDL